MKVDKFFSELKTGQVLPEGWIKEQIKRDMDGFVGHLDEYCKEASTRIFSKGRVTITRDGFWGTWWNGEIEGNWIDGLIRSAFLSDSDKMKEKVIQYINEVIDYADEDGYIGIYQEDARFGNGETDGELWCQSRILLAMIGYYEATKDERVLNAAIKAGKLTVSKYGPQANNRSYFDIPDIDGSKSHGLTIIEPMLMLYDLTKEDAFVDFCVFLYEDFSKTPITDMFNDYQLDLLLDSKRPFLSHGVHTTEHLRTPLMLYVYTKEEKYRIAYINAYNKLNRYLGITGACKSDEATGSFEVAWDEVTQPEEAGVEPTENIPTLHPAYPLPETGYEYCTLTELLLSLHYALYVTGDAKYADMAERLSLNATMGARMSDGKAIGYLSSDNLYEASKKKGRRWDYSATHDDVAVCCVPNAGRWLPYHLTRSWAKRDNDTLCALFYGPSILNDKLLDEPITIQQKTSYPFDDEINFVIKIENKTKGRLMFRIPSWCQTPYFSVNNELVDYEVIDGYVTIERVYKDGDEILLKLPSIVKVQETVDQTCAIVKGPLVYSYEIEGEFTKTHSYSKEGFYDLDCVAKPSQFYDYILKTENQIAQNKYYEVKKDLESKSFPWDQSPIFIVAKALKNQSQPTHIKLVPIGCTNLRRTTFPFIVE